MNLKKVKELRSLSRYLWLSSLIFLSLGSQLFGQSNYKCKSIVSGDPVILDSLLVEENSITFSDPDISFQWDAESNKLSITNTENLPEQVEVCYRVQSSNLLEPIAERDIAQMEVGDFNEVGLVVQPEFQEEILFDTPGLYKAGSITRGITVGNRQNLFVNSALNLQLSGRLADNIFIEALITDQNIPYQPEGNTQQIRDFDNVYISIFNDQWRLLAGDVVLQNHPRNYFLKYYKNQQGFQLQKKSELDAMTVHSQLSVAASKGKFATTFVEAIEGVQGPYKLRGPDGERFIIILANSERVYLDGLPVERGFDKDYIIDYNIGEIIFNPSIQITRYTRIRVDFEYAQQNFPRSSIQTSHIVEKDNMTIYADYYRESDNENNPLFGSLELNDLSVLDSLGDGSAAFISGVSQAEFSRDRLLYERRDTVLNGVLYTYYQISSDPELAQYQVTFTDVGFGNGDYVLGNSTSNGRVYNWLPPLSNGQSRGNFAPLVRIVTPNRRQMGVLGSALTVAPGLTFNQEVAISNEDQNLLSDLDDQDNSALAWKGSLSLTDVDLGSSGYMLSSKLGYEFDDRFFKPIDRFRSIDFDRDWSYRFPNDSSSASERILDFGISVTKDPSNTLSYQIIRRQRLNVINGWQHTLNYNQELGPFFLKSTNFLLDSRVLGNQSDWKRSFNETGINLWKIQTGYYYDVDQNEIRATIDGTVLSSAMHYQEQGLFLRSADSTNLFFQIKGGIRNDKIPSEGTLDKYTEIRKIGGKVGLYNIEKHQFTGSLNWMEVEDIASEKEDQTIAGALQASDKILYDAISSDLLYSTSSARELRREYVFTLVGAGQGTHTWRDENQDGIQQLNEFYEAINIDEKNFAKLLLPTDEYISAFQTIYRHNIDIESPSTWKNQSGLKSVLNEVSFQANWNVNFKTTSNDLSDRLSPFQVHEDSSVISSRTFNRYSLFINRNRPGFGFQLDRKIRSNRFLNQNGFENFEDDSWNPHTRINIAQLYQLDFDFLAGQIRNSSDFLENRNFLLSQIQYHASITMLFNPQNRVRLGYQNSRKENIEGESPDEFSVANEYMTEYTWSKVKLGNLNCVVRFVNIDFEGEEDTYLGYTLLQALRPGNNTTVNINWQQRLKKGMQLSLQYFGRKSEEQPVIHSGSVQITAFF